MVRIGSAVILVWLLIGVLAAGQRGYFSDAQDATCSRLANTAITVVAGPLNYIGVDPQVGCEVPQPS
jgi:ABC-type dipeptide/oligopeptide/nickel transport system permease subunit